MKALKLVFKIISTVDIFFIVCCFLMLYFSSSIGTTVLSVSASSLAFTFLALLAGFALTFYDKKLAVYLGLGFEGAGYLLFLAVLPTLTLRAEQAITIITLILYGLAFVSFITAIILYVVANCMSDKKNSKVSGEDAAMEKLMKWKKLQENNIITEEEFEVKKKEIFIKMVEEQ